MRLSLRVFELFDFLVPSKNDGLLVFDPDKLSRVDESQSLEGIAVNLAHETPHVRLDAQEGHVTVRHEERNVVMWV